VWFGLDWFSSLCLFLVRGHDHVVSFLGKKEAQTPKGLDNGSHSTYAITDSSSTCWIGGSCDHEGFTVFTLDALLDLFGDDLLVSAMKYAVDALCEDLGGLERTNGSVARLTIWADLF